MSKFWKPYPKKSERSCIENNKTVVAYIVYVMLQHADRGLG